MTTTAKVIPLYQAPCQVIGARQMRASQAIKRLQELIDLHGDLKIDGLPGVEYWPADSEGPAFLYVID